VGLGLAAGSAYYRDELVSLVVKPAAEEIAPEPALPLEIVHSITVSGDEEGASIWVDGKDTGLLTPTAVELSGLEDDEVVLELQRSGFTVARTTLLLNHDTQAEWQAIEAAAAETFTVVSSPPGARVSINGEPIEGTTPIEILLVFDEDYELQVSLDEYLDEGVAFGFPDELNDGIRQSHLFFFEMTPRIPPGRIVFDAPYAVRVSVAGQTFGPSRSNDITLPPGSYEVLLRSEEVFLDEPRRVQVDSGSVFELTLPPAVELQVSAHPGNCRVFVNGIFQDVTPFALRMVPGTHEFTFEWPTLNREMKFVERITRQSTEVFQAIE